MAAWLAASKRQAGGHRDAGPRPSATIAGGGGRIGSVGVRLTGRRQADAAGWRSQPCHSNGLQRCEERLALSSIAPSSRLSVQYEKRMQIHPAAKPTPCNLTCLTGTADAQCIGRRLIAAHTKQALRWRNSRRLSRSPSCCLGSGDGASSWVLAAVRCKRPCIQVPARMTWSEPVRSVSQPSHADQGLFQLRAAGTVRRTHPPPGSPLCGFGPGRNTTPVPLRQLIAVLSRAQSTAESARSCTTGCRECYRSPSARGRTSACPGSRRPT